MTERDSVVGMNEGDIHTMTYTPDEGEEIQAGDHILEEEVVVKHFSRGDMGNSPFQ